METDLEAFCDTPGCTNRVRRYPWNSDHRYETRYCIPCALERQQFAASAAIPAEGTRAPVAAKEAAE
jgi:hypothetical protein